MTDITTRERVAAAMVGCLIEKFRGLPDHTREWWLKRADEALAAMQLPTETRWVIDRSKGLAAYRSAVRDAIKAGADIHAQQQAGYRAEFFANLRDFAFGVSDEVLRSALIAAQMLGPERNARALVRALADQEEGK